MTATDSHSFPASCFSRVQAGESRTTSMVEWIAGQIQSRPFRRERLEIELLRWSVELGSSLKNETALIFFLRSHIFNY